MKLIQWANNKGCTLKLTDNEAKELSRQLEDPNVTKISYEQLEIEIEG